MRLALAGILLCGALSYGQFETSEVLGTVRDPSGSPVSKAKVTLLNQNTGIQATTTTNDAGEYDFLNVKVGSYTRDGGDGGILQVHRPGYQGGRRSAPARGCEAAPSEWSPNAVTVTGAASALETDSANTAR